MALSSPTDKFEFGTRLGIFVSVEAALFVPPSLWKIVFDCSQIFASLSAISASVVLCYTGVRSFAVGCLLFG